jgi:hypothetical protein
MAQITTNDIHGELSASRADTQSDPGQRDAASAALTDPFPGDASSWRIDATVWIQERPPTAFSS